MTTKTDNASLGTKLLLRTDFLDRYHADGARVFDCCMGNGELWRRLRVGRQINYWGVDVKPARGRVKIDSQRVLAMPGWDFDVVDVDTYGMPWAHWLAILRNGNKPVTVFLTVGNVVMGGSGLCKDLRALLGLGDMKIPAAICGCINGDFTLEAIGHAENCGWRITESKEAVPDNPGTARYFGVRMEPYSGSSAG